MHIQWNVNVPLPITAALQLRISISTSMLYTVIPNYIHCEYNLPYNHDAKLYWRGTSSRLLIVFSHSSFWVQNCGDHLLVSLAAIVCFDWHNSMNKVSSGHALWLCVQLPGIVRYTNSADFHNVFDLMLQAVVHSLRNKILLHLHCMNTVIGNSVLMFCWWIKLL